MWFEVYWYYKFHPKKKDQYYEIKWNKRAMNRWESKQYVQNCANFEKICEIIRVSFLKDNRTVSLITKHKCFKMRSHPTRLLTEPPIQGRQSKSIWPPLREVIAQITRMVSDSQIELPASLLARKLLKSMGAKKGRNEAFKF